MPTLIIAHGADVPHVILCRLPPELTFLPRLQRCLSAAEGNARKRMLVGLGTIVLASDGWAPVGVRSRPVSRPPLRHSLRTGWAGRTGGWVAEGTGRDEGRTLLGLVAARPCRFGIILPGLGPNGGPGAYLKATQLELSYIVIKFPRFLKNLGGWFPKGAGWRPGWQRSYWDVHWMTCPECLARLEAIRARTSRECAGRSLTELRTKKNGVELS